MGESMEVEKNLDSTKAIILLTLGVFLSTIGWLPLMDNSYIQFSQIHVAIKFFVTTLGLVAFYLSYIYFRKDFVKDNKEKVNYELKDMDKNRKNILKTYKPSLYVPLENNFCDIASSSCHTNVFPHIFILGDVVDKYEFIPNIGYKFNGRNMISVHSQHNFPSGREERTFIFAIKPTDFANTETPMFFFSYGQRIKHDCDTGISNHDKSFGVFWGEPKPDEEIPDNYKGSGVRIFFYCEHCDQDRTSENCDTEVIYNIKEINKFIIMAVTYDGRMLRFYANGEEIFSEEYILSTSKTPYLNIGGFVHHSEDGAMIVKDLDYTMKGHIREFMMLRKSLPASKVRGLTAEIRSIIESY